MAYTHLAPPARDMLELSPEERILRIQADKWVGYDRARQVLAKLTDLSQHPATTRMPCMLLVGDSNNGKTHILRRFAAQHPARDDPAAGHVSVPVLYLEAPAVPSETRLYESILDRLFAPYRSSDRVQKKQAQVIALLRQIDLKLLIIDEMSNALAGNVTKQREMLNAIKFLANEVGRPIVAAGVRDSLRLMQMDEQIGNRFEPVLLPRWTLATDYCRLLTSLEAMTPLVHASGLGLDTMAAKLLSMSEGLIGETCQLVKRAAIEAIRGQEERITPATLGRIGGVPPSRRRRHIETPG